MCGKYIVIEGLEGAGKTSVKETVFKSLREFGIQKIIFTREPGGTQLAERLRDLVLDAKLTNNEVINDKAELLIFYAARIQLVETVIKPALNKGYWVIGDRHDLSTYAYQGGGRGINCNILTTLRKIMLGNFRAHLTLYLDVTPEIGLNRIYSTGSLDRIENELLDFFYRTRAYYLEFAKQDDTTHIINADQPLKAVVNMIHKIITQWLQEQQI